MPPKPRMKLRRDGHQMVVTEARPWRQSVILNSRVTIIARQAHKVATWIAVGDPKRFVMVRVDRTESVKSIRC